MELKDKIITGMMNDIADVEYKQKKNMKKCITKC